jgi:hypothetical protein
MKRDIYIEIDQVIYQWNDTHITYNVVAANEYHDSETDVFFGDIYDRDTDGDDPVHVHNHCCSIYHKRDWKNMAHLDMKYIPVLVAYINGKINDTDPI